MAEIVEDTRDWQMARLHKGMDSVTWGLPETGEFSHGGNSETWINNKKLC